MCLGYALKGSSWFSFLLITHRGTYNPSLGNIPKKKNLFMKEEEGKLQNYNPLLYYTYTYLTLLMYILLKIPEI